MVRGDPVTPGGAGSPRTKSERQRRQARTVQTPLGPARVHLHRATQPRGSLVLGHGAGGGIDAPDLVAIARELPGDGWTVVLVEQPWRVAGRRVAPAPTSLDRAWQPVLAALTSGRARLTHPLVVGGRSAGARVACRTAAAVGADAVLALSFPLRPPGKPRSRAAELTAVAADGIPVHVVQGERDPFGTPEDVRAVLGDPAYASSAAGAHGFTTAPDDVVAAVRAFLSRVRGEWGPPEGR